MSKAKTKTAKKTAGAEAKAAKAKAAGADVMPFAKFAIKDLEPAAYNPRRISAAAMKGLRESLRRFGCVEPIVVNVHDGRRRIVGGHQRAAALRKEKGARASVWCVTVDLPDAEEKLLNVALNNPQIQGEFTADLDEVIAALREELADDQVLMDLRIGELQDQIEAMEEGAEATIPDRQFGVFVDCPTEGEQRRVYEQLKAEGWTCRLLTL